MLSQYISHIDQSFADAQKNKSKITQEILNLEGMSGSRTRHLYNNLCSMSDCRYLEIGTWKGSTVCSAMFKNKANVTCIDNWAQFNGPKNEFLLNFNKFKGENIANFIESDCFKVNINKLPKYNIYLYDGDHSELSHYRALSYFQTCLDDIFIYICDDYNWKQVRDGTQHAINDLNLKILHQQELRTTNNNTHPPLGSDLQKLWHNGIYVAILQKPTQTPF
jgi:hypothetical protein